MSSPTPIQWLNSSGGIIAKTSTLALVFSALIAANLIAFKHSVELSNTTINLRMHTLQLKTSMPADLITRNAKKVFQIIEPVTLHIFF
jgi:hypothetical protein